MNRAAFTSLQRCVPWTIRMMIKLTIRATSVSIDDMLSAPSCIVPVPAVDGWALIVLALSLLTLQKIRGANHAETARR